MAGLITVALLAGTARTLEQSKHLSILDFGGKPLEHFNNQAAIKKAMAACAAARGCTLTFPLPPSPTHYVLTKGTPYHPYGPPVAATYRTSAFNLTSNLTLVVPAGVQLRGTEDFVDNCGGADTSSCDSLDSPNWPVLPWPAFPMRPNRAGDATPSKQAFIRGFNLTNITLRGGGEIHAGGGWWWCVRMTAAGQAGGGHSPKWCPSMVKAGHIPKLSLTPPRMLHLIGCNRVLVDNLTISNSPYVTRLPQLPSVSSVLPQYGRNVCDSAVHPPSKQLI